MLAVITSVTDKPTKAKVYCVERFPRLKNTPPAITNNTQGQFSGNCHHKKTQKPVETQTMSLIYKLHSQEAASLILNMQSILVMN